MRTPRPFSWRHTPGLGALAAAVLVFLYAPLLVLVVYAFNANRLVTVWTGFSFAWFGEVVTNADIQGAAMNSLVIAVVAAIASTLIATAGAIALSRGRLGWIGGLAGGLIVLPLIVPEMVVAITTLIFFSAVGMRNGLLNLMIAHTVFCIPFALIPIRARLGEIGGSYEEAGRDLYAGEWQLFRRILLPLLMPAIAAGLILAFVVSLDDFIISMMVSSAGSTTLPVYVYGMMRLGVTPEVNAISTILLAVSVVFVAAALLAGRRLQRTRY